MADEMLSQEEIEALMAQSATGGPTGQEPSDGDAANVAPPPQPEPVVQRAASEPVVQPLTLNPMAAATGGQGSNGVQLILDVQLQVTVELGRATMLVRDVLALGPGSVVELDTHAGEPVEVVVNNKTIARGEVVIIDENFGVRITEIVTGAERESRARAA